MNPEIQVHQATLAYVKDTVVQSPVGAYVAGVRSLVQAPSYIAAGAFSATAWIHLADVMPNLGVLATGPLKVTTGTGAISTAVASDFDSGSASAAGLAHPERRDTAANWTSSNPTLPAGVVGIVTDTRRFKVGDGATAWTSLPYAGFIMPAVSRTPSGFWAPIPGLCSVNATATGAGSSGIAQFHPLDLEPGRTYDRLGIFTSVAEVAGTTTWRVGLYGDLNGLPDMAAGPLVQGTLVTTTPTGTKATSAISYTPLGVAHWACVLYVESSAPSTRATVRTTNIGVRSASADVGGTAAQHGFTAGTTGTYAALPTSLAALTENIAPVLVSARAV